MEAGMLEKFSYKFFENSEASIAEITANCGCP
jgi:hypothetical protein